MKLPRSAILKAVLGALFLFLSFLFASSLILLIIALPAGIILLVDGLGFFERRNGRRLKLSALELTILEMLSRKKDENEIANATGVSPPLISQKIGKLFEDGYITDGKYLTEKGFEALYKERVKSEEN